MTIRTTLIVSSVLLTSCSMVNIPALTPYKMEVRQGNLVSQAMRDQLDLGMSKQQVQQLLGTAMINDAFHGNRWDYVYSLEQDGKVVEKQHLALYFDGETLSKIDDGGTIIEAPDTSGDDSQLASSTPDIAPTVVAAAEPVRDTYGAEPATLGALADTQLASGKLDEPVVITPEPSYAPAPTDTPEPVASSYAASEPIAAAPVRSGAEDADAAVLDELQNLAPSPSLPVPSAPSYQTAAEPVSAAPSYAAEPEAYKSRSNVVASSGGSNAAVLSVIEAWGKAWSNKDVDGYLARYSSSYQPGGISHAAWQEKRRAVIGRAGNISLGIQNLDVAVRGDRAVAGFTQKYRADNHQDSSFKTLELQQLGGEWLIVNETTHAKRPRLSSLLDKPAVAVAAPTLAAAPVVASEPSRASTSSDMAAVDPLDAVMQQLMAWRDAWSAKDVNRYLASYADSFKPDNGLSLSAWKAQRKARLSGAETIDVQLHDVNIDLKGDKRAVVTLRQDYRANHYQDSIEKKLTFKRIGQQWLIVNEASGKVLSKSKAPAESAPVATAARSYQVEAPVAAPSSYAPAAAALSGNERQELIDRLQNWGKAWSVGDVEQYLANYANHFKPDGMNRSAWEAQRRGRVTPNKQILLEVSDVKINVQNPARATIEFLQEYRAPGFQDRTRKILVLEKVGQDWLIVSEKAR